MAHGLSSSTVCEIFLDQGLNHVHCTGNQILYHWATREALPSITFTFCLYICHRQTILLQSFPSGKQVRKLVPSMSMYYYIKFAINMDNSNIIWHIFLLMQRNESHLFNTHIWKSHSAVLRWKGIYKLKGNLRQDIWQSFSRIIWFLTSCSR